MSRLDKKDLKILHELSKNSRTSITQLAKNSCLSREVTQYRLKRLIRKNIIKEFITEIDENKLGFSRHLIYFAFQNVNEEKEKEIISYLIHHPFVSWTTTSTGKWSIIFDFIAKDLEQVNKFILEIKEKYNDRIGEYIIASQMDFKHFNSKFYLQEKEETTKTKKIIKHKVDKKDLQILKLLSNNARIDYIQLGKELKLSANAIKNRIKVLQKAKIITGFTIQANKEILEQEQYYIQLNLIGQTKEDQVIAYVKEHPNMNAYYKPLGHWSLEIAVFVKNPGELRKIILELRNAFGSIMKIHDTMLFYEEPKSNHLPEGVFDEKFYDF
jgi:DNA-binding Lrp family transcriptional regulator